MLQRGWEDTWAQEWGMRNAAQNGAGLKKWGGLQKNGASFKKWVQLQEMGRVAKKSGHSP